MIISCTKITGKNQADAEAVLDIPDPNWTVIQATAAAMVQEGQKRASVSSKQALLRAAIAASIQAELDALKAATDTPSTTVAQCANVIKVLVRQNKKLLRAVALLMGDDGPDEI